MNYIVYCQKEKKIKSIHEYGTILKSYKVLLSGILEEEIKTIKMLCEMNSYGNLSKEILSSFDE